MHPLDAATRTAGGFGETAYRPRLPGHRTAGSFGRDATGFHLGYRPWLDGLRGVAILLVLAYHLRFLPGGFLGVDVFFVLSGFLITSLLAEEWQRHAAISLKRFYLRRSLRLFPALFALLLACALATLLFRSGAEAVGLWREMVVAACYLANWPTLHRTPMAMLGHTWSLSLEEQFYLLWPLSLYGMLRWGLPRRRILLLVGVGILTSACLRFGLYRLHRVPGPANAINVMRLYSGLDTRADALLVGCLVGLLAAWDLLPKSRRFRHGTGAAALAAVAGLGYLAAYRTLDHSQFYHGLFTGVALMVGVILVRLLAAPVRCVSWALESAALVGIGRISYALYLVHQPIIYWLQPEGLGWQTPGNTLAVAALSFAAAVLSYYGLEGPCLRLKHRLRAPGEHMDIERADQTPALSPTRQRGNELFPRRRRVDLKRC